MQFQVPQFIEIEDKIVGPFTGRQFAFLLGGFGGGFIFYKILSPYIGSLSYVIVIPWIIFGAALAYYKVNSRPFITILEAWFKFKLGSKRYLWRKEATVERKEADGLDQLINRAGIQKTAVPKLTAGKLKDIAWSLDIQEKIE